VFSSPGGGEENGAAEGTRTLDIQLGKLTLYQLSYGRVSGILAHGPGGAALWWGLSWGSVPDWGEGSNLLGVWTGGSGGNQSDWSGDLDGVDIWGYSARGSETPCTKHTMTSTKNTIEPLEKLLSDTYTLYVKTHSYHWNVTGPMFTTLHTMFEAQYNELAMAVDEIAERIRALESFAPGSFSQFMERATVKEDRTVPKATDMIANLVKDHEELARSAKAVIKAAEEDGDDATGDLGVRRTEVHDKAAWMLRSHLEG
jgi:starvation-inducible DNA-binding protein